MRLTLKISLLKRSALDNLEKHDVINSNTKNRQKICLVHLLGNFRRMMKLLPTPVEVWASTSLR